MKIDRLIGIITTLQQKGKVTAEYLARRYEVSVRTISRDIEDICKAGIPIVTSQGRSGGISLMEGFSLDTTLFTESELSSILAGLKSLDSVSNSNSARLLADKLGKGSLSVDEHIVIDLASFYKDDLARKIEIIDGAIKSRRRIRFRYYYDRGESSKLIEPYLILFKWSSWYVFGYCTERKDFRMYKLLRLWELEVTEEHFEPREIPEEKLNFGSHITDDYFVTAIYEPSEKYRLVEEYGPESFTILPDGRLYTRWGFTRLVDALHFILGSLDRVEVTDPPEMRELMRDTLRRILEKYPET